MLPPARPTSTVGRHYTGRDPPTSPPCPSPSGHGGCSNGAIGHGSAACCASWSLPVLHRVESDAPSPSKARPYHPMPLPHRLRLASGRSVCWLLSQPKTPLVCLVNCAPPVHPGCRSVDPQSFFFSHYHASTSAMPLVKRVDPLPLPPQPFVVSTTGTFDGDDGKWSTFFINLGDDNSAHGQNFKIVPSTSSPLTQVPAVADWCNEDCAKSRGLLLFGRDQPRGYIESTFWKRAGIYNIPLPYWWSNGITSNSSSSLNATWGTENVGLGESSSQSYIIPDSYVARYGFKDFFLGSLGLAAGATGSPDAAKQNFLDSFYGAHWIASLSYGYTAGAWYRKLLHLRRH